MAAKSKQNSPEEREAELEPFKITGQLIGVVKDPDGNIVGEQIMADLAIYRPNFDKVEQLIEEAVEKA
jgi:hypothetical protein